MLTLTTTAQAPSLMSIPPAPSRLKKENCSLLNVNAKHPSHSWKNIYQVKKQFTLENLQVRRQNLMNNYSKYTEIINILTINQSVQKLQGKQSRKKVKLK